jgi:hypothetical protein
LEVVVLGQVEHLELPDQFDLEVLAEVVVPITQ